MLRRLSTVRGKLLLLVVTTTAAALLLMGLAMVAYDVYTFRVSVANDLDAQADILGLAVAPALQFDDPEAASEYLALLKARPSVVSAAIYTTKGALLATYPKGPHEQGQHVFPMLPEADGYHFDGNHLTLSKRIVLDGEIVGTLYFNTAYEPFSRLRDYLGILSIVLVVSLAAAALLSSHFQKSFTSPILDVTTIAKRVMEERNFSLRAQRQTDDEIGVLVTAFNGMLGEIGKQTETLEASNRELQRESVERQRAERAKDRSERRVHTLVSALTQVVWVTDSNGRFLDEERESWQTYTGQTREQYQGLGWRDAFDAESRAALDLAWARAILSPAPFELALRLHHAGSDRLRYVELRAVPLLEEDGTCGEWIGAIQDTDDRRNLEQNLRTLNAELEQRVADRTSRLEEANKELEGFSYSVSHDLRAPIRAIGGFCTLLSRDHDAALDAEAKRKIGIIKGEAERMGALIDDLLAFSRLGRKGMQPAELDMAALASTVYQRLSRELNGREVQFRVGALPMAFGDRSLFEQVWVNLLSNALKFSAKKPNPSIEVGGITAETEHVYFVRDNGAGFDPKHQANLFGVFQRLHHSDEFPGTGVGLALVHRIVTRHGGKIWADAKVGEGATFHFTVPKEQTSGRV
jgi:PAS domain S-box-containing protein